MKPFATGQIRNVALVAHHGVGKTSLAEAMLFEAGAIQRLGRVEEGTTTSDFDAEALQAVRVDRVTAEHGLTFLRVHAGLGEQLVRDLARVGERAVGMRVVGLEEDRAEADVVSAAEPVEIVEHATEHMAARQTFLITEDGARSAADMLLALLGMEPQVVEGPANRHESTYRAAEIPRYQFERSKLDVISFIRANHRLPPSAWIGSQRLSLPDFAATLAADQGGAGAVAVHKGNPEMERYIATDPIRAFAWPIHPEGFSGANLLELARLQAWTLKPARLR